LGEDAYDNVVKNLRGLPFLLAIESAVLFAPFLFHMLYGMVIIFTTRPNNNRLGFRRNWAYIAQRITAMIVFVFIIYHVVGLRFMDAHNVDNVSALLYAKFSHPFTYWWYVVGIGCTVFHLANGVCTFLMTWGITIGGRSQKLAAAAMTVVGLVLFGMGIMSLNGFLNHPPKRQPVKIEAKGKSALAPTARVAMN
jgi:succinate dehydrogenase / fumarate reductase cytochrome b subunit